MTTIKYVIKGEKYNEFLADGKFSVWLGILKANAVYKDNDFLIEAFVFGKKIFSTNKDVEEVVEDIKDETIKVSEAVTKPIDKEVLDKSESKKQVKNKDKIYKENLIPVSYTHLPWLCKIAANKSKDYLKSAYCKHVVLDGEDETFDRPSNFEQPEKEYLGKESVENIESVIRGLKEPYLKVSVLYFIEEKNIQEISDILKRPKKTVQTQIQRAKGIIKEKLRQGGAV